MRRTFYRLLAAVRDVPSIDLLVARVAKETGTPLFELVQILRRISSTKLTADARAWKDWWASAREDWTRPDGAENDDPFEMKETSRYFGLRLRSTRILFILDRSLSMDWPVDSYYSKDRGGTVAGSGERKIDIAKRELTRALDTLDASCSFNVLVYGTTVKLMNQRPQSATAPNLERARKWIKKLKLEGSTNLSGALLEGFENTRPGQPLADASIADTIVVLTDGEPNGGPIADEDDTLAELKRLNPHGMIRVHTVFLGIDGDAKFMRSLAEQNDGQFIHFKK